MNTISKLLIATAVAASFAAPALALDYNSESFPAAERYVAPIAPVQANSADWTNAYAMDRGAPTNNTAAGTVGGFSQINGGN